MVKSRNYSLVLLIVSVSLVYLNSFSAPMTFDDYLNIRYNPSIRSFSSFINTFLAPRDTALQGRPLVNFSFALNYVFFNDSLWSYHLLNNLIHILATLSLFGCIRRTFVHSNLPQYYHDSSIYLAFLCSLLWAIHPLHTAAVTYLSQRMESLMGMFFLISFFAAIRGWEQNKIKWHFIAVFACILGVGCKEVIAVLPLLVLSYDMIFNKRNFCSTLRQSPLLYGGYALALGLLALLLSRGGIIASGALSQNRTIFDYLLIQTKVLMHYLWLIVYPMDMSFDYLFSDVSIVEAAAPGVFLLLCLVFTFFGVRKRILLAYPVLFFFLTLAPTSSFLPMMFEACVYRLYLPLAGALVLIIVVVYEGMRLLVRYVPLRSVNFLVFVLSLLVIIYLATGTVLRNLEHQHPLLLWTDTLAKQPRNYRAAGWVAWTLLELNRPQEAIPYYKKVLSLQPDHFKANFWLGKIYIGLEECDNAFMYLNRADFLRTGTPEVHIALEQLKNRCPSNMSSIFSK